jgi:hypothetical protein
LGRDILQRPEGGETDRQLLRSRAFGQRRHDGLTHDRLEKVATDRQDLLQPFGGHSALGDREGGIGAVHEGFEPCDPGFLRAGGGPDRLLLCCVSPSRLETSGGLDRSGGRDKGRRQHLGQFVCLCLGLFDESLEPFRYPVVAILDRGSRLAVHVAGDDGARILVDFLTDETIAAQAIIALTAHSDGEILDRPVSVISPLTQLVIKRAYEAYPVKRENNDRDIEYWTGMIGGEPWSDGHWAVVTAIEAEYAAKFSA